MSRFLQTAALALSVSLLTMPATTVLAAGHGTPDAQTPAEETICNPNVGLRGPAYGLCVAYCEANDCELDPTQNACEVLLRNFYKATGRTDVPCVTVYYPEVR